MDRELVNLDFRVPMRLRTVPSTKLERTFYLFYELV